MRPNKTSLTAHVPNLDNLKILDWGCGNSSLLTVEDASEPAIAQSNYVGVEMNTNFSDNVTNYPDASYYYRHLPHQIKAYNVDGNVQPLSGIHIDQYDVVFAYSVYSHATIEQIDHDLELLYPFLKPGGKLIFSYCDSDWGKILRSKRSMKGEEIVPALGEFDNITDYLYYIDSNRLTKVFDHVVEQVDYFISLFNQSWLQSRLETLFPGTTISHHAGDGADFFAWWENNTGIRYRTNEEGEEVPWWPTQPSFCITAP